MSQLAGNLDFNAQNPQNLEQLLTDQNQKDQKLDAEQKFISHTYSAERVVGNGSFGVVFVANIAETGNVVAVKKVLQDKRYKNRELQIIRELYHPNIMG